MLAVVQVDACGEKYMNFLLEGGKQIVLETEQARRDGPTVLQQHGIVFDRSVDLRPPTNLEQPAAQATRADLPPAGDIPDAGSFFLT